MRNMNFSSTEMLYMYTGCSKYVKRTRNERTRNVEVASALNLIPIYAYVRKIIYVRSQDHLNHSFFIKIKTSLV